MTQNARAVAQHIVDIPLTLHIPDIGAFSLIDEVGGAANRAEGPHWRVDTTGHDQLGPLEQIGVRGVGMV